MNNQDKLPRHSKSFSLKRISAFIGLIGIIIAAIVGGSQIIQQVQQSRKINKEVRMFLEVGDRFTEQFKLNKAIEEYQKALELGQIGDDID